MESSGGGRKRASSFHEDFDVPSAAVNRTSNQHSHAVHNNLNSSDRLSPIQYMTPQFNTNQNGPPEPLNLSQFEDEDDEDTNENEEETYCRGRSRSHSMHQNDARTDLPPGVLSPLENSINNANIHPSSENKSFERISERKGPLHQREVKALKQVLYATCTT